MFTLGFKFLCSRRKWTILIVLALCLIISSVLSIFTASEAIRAALMEKSYLQYGKNSGVLVGIEKSKSEINKEVKNIGEFQLIDWIPLENSNSATIGWMDKGAVDLSKIKVMEGRLPIGKNEVAIESAYLKLFNSSWAIGDMITLDGKEKQWKVKIVGIISNYSSKRYIPFQFQKELAFPNIFISEQYKDKSSKRNYLINYEDGKNTTLKKTENLLAEYDDKGFVNEKLFLEGLRDYDTIRNISIFYQTVILFISIFSISSLFAYFNKSQRRKIGVLKALGIKRMQLYFFYFSQTFILFFSGLILAVPLNYVFKFLIINKSFKEGISTYQNQTYTFSICWILFLFFMVLFLSFWEIFRSRNLSIKMLINGVEKIPIVNILINKNIKRFEIKQLTRQLFLFPKQFILTVAMISLSILILLFSVIFQKETEGIWDIDEYYYLNSQEVYGFDTQDNLPILLRKGLTFSEQQVTNLKILPGVQYVEKNPFMVDVIPLITSQQKTKDITQWLDNQGEIITYNQKWIVPNVKYEIIDKEEFSQLFPEDDYKAFRGKIMIFVPNKDGRKDANLNNLKGETIEFIKQEKHEGKLQKIKEQFEVYSVNNETYVKQINNKNKISYDGFTIIFDKDTMQNSKLFNGYMELGIFLDTNITENELKKIDDYVNQMIATVPGSLLQNIPEFIQNDTKITSLLGFLAKFSFIITFLLTVTSMFIIVFSKYQLQKKEWGIYLSLGMSKRKLYYFLTSEMVVYCLIAALMSFIIIFLYLMGAVLTFPLSYYLYYYLLVIIYMSLLLIVGSFIIYKIVINQTVYNMLREVE
ncbi:hypothetical protein ABW02_08315 [Niallia circulans]|uniref:ABC3 transporter permease C-terminal domain-containing protein n=2 Tax=Niallia circulans TaxID=1397 RepID=A0A0J1LDH7_NIACI|nr:ABC transporter permease [Niallia circulans]KLV26970.1 hypothetical protein ABW02_08315 [Niallia circulans]